MRIGLAYDLKDDFAPLPPAPDDALEEYDSEATIASLAATLARLGHEPVRLGGGRRFAERLVADAPVDLVFNLAEGAGGRCRESRVPALCELLGIAVTHGDPLALSLALDKALAKRVVASHGLATPAFVVVRDAAELEAAPLPPFPLIAKPNHEGSSIGIRRGSRCETREALAADVARLVADYRQEILIERFLPGAELTVGVVGNGADAEVLGVMEIGPRRGALERFVYSLEVKRDYENEVDYHVPPRLPARIVREAAAIALAAYAALGCRDVARIDLRCDEAGRPQFLEANPLPGLDPRRSDLPILCASAGITYDELVRRILHAAVARIEGARP